MSNRAIKKTLIVEDMRNINTASDSAFKVKKMTNSTVFKIGQYLSKTQLDIYCNMTDWTVNITEYKR